ncbi:right-handed parallel beta-helix repeat-containing protein [Paenibacillus solisilvae]|uniref:Right-handed parallel beta-helix repeat-containing protein n=1 Tax=Paenibacillus solisilvae TaxID=2486751 RepID=A0ABW0W9R2_9BACL
MQENKGSFPVQTVIRLADYGAVPDTGEDTQLAMRRAIEAAAALARPALIECAAGRYDFYTDEAVRAPYYITNTASETENPDITRTIGLLFRGLCNVTLDGKGALFVFHGKQTMFVIDACEQIEIRNLHVDYHCPTVVEMTVVESGSHHLDVRVHPDSHYEIENGRLFWIGDGWRFHEGPMQQFERESGTTWRIDNLIEQATFAEEKEPGLLRLNFVKAPVLPVGAVLQARDGIRDQVGVLMVESRDVRWHHVGMHFMHGLGMVGQFSENLTLENVELAPRLETGRTVAAFADFVHLSGCRGTIRVADCRFAGAHDDAINVHGTYLRIVGQPEDNRIRVRFMHPQTYGIKAFHPGDAVDFVRGATLEHYADNVVKSVRIISQREIELSLQQAVPSDIRQGDAVENVTWTPEVEIVRNRFTGIPTRGILVSTCRRVLIEDNEFDRMAMSAILVADEAWEWYESGRVADLSIRGNRFIACGSTELAVILIKPEAPELGDQVQIHRHIRIERNEFMLNEAAALDARHTDELVFIDNSIACTQKAPTEENTIRLTSCTGIELSGNRYRQGNR